VSVKKSLNIAIDASRTTVNRVTGTEHYARQLITHLIYLNDTLKEPHRITLYFRDEPEKDTLPHSFFTTRQIKPMRRLWTHIALARAINQDKPDVTFVPAHTLPFWFEGKAVVTVHDLGYRLFPQAHPWKQRQYLELTTRYSAYRANLILADSLATARDLGEFYGTNREKIRVVYPGVEAPMYTTSPFDMREKYQLNTAYVVFIGTLQPRKNIERMVQAFCQWRDTLGKDKDVQLILAGGKGWLFDEAWVQGHDDVRLLGYIDEEDKGALLANAECLLFPSLYEGFGFPTLEAMHMGTAVIASNTSSLPELVGNAGILVNPLDINEIVGALDLIIGNTAMKQNFRTEGMKRTDLFTWERAAEDAMQALEDVGFS